MALWGVGGVCLVLGQALCRLVPLALEPFDAGMSSFQLVAYVGFAILMGYSEGYRGFQRSFAPRVVARAWGLVSAPLRYRLLAPVVCMGLVYGTRHRLITSWVFLVGIVCLVILVRILSQPWRGIVDGGVVVGLSWGLVAVLGFTMSAWRGRPLADPEFPVR